MAGAPTANLCAIVAVDRGRLSPENEAMIIAMSVFAAYNVLITVDEAHNLRMLSVEDAAVKAVDDAVNTLQLGDAIKGVLTKFGIANDAEELPLVVSRELRGFTDYVTKANADAFLSHLIAGLKAGLIVRFFLGMVDPFPPPSMSTDKRAMGLSRQFVGFTVVGRCLATFVQRG